MIKSILNHLKSCNGCSSHGLYCFVYSNHDHYNSKTIAETAKQPSGSIDIDIGNKVNELSEISKKELKNMIFSALKKGY